jgi:CRP-like cAMP-binding protein
MLIDGFMLRTLDGAGGKRHAVSFHVPGDFVDLHCFALKRLDHNIDTVGRVKVGYVPHSALDEVMRDKPHLARVFWFSTLLDAAMHREWIMTLEELTAPRRIAHIFAEIWRRLRMVGLGTSDGFETPLTQSDLSEMCGATPIHTNRALRELRHAGIADFNRGRVTIPYQAALEDYARFTPDYLYGPWSLSPDSRHADPV